MNENLIAPASSAEQNTPAAATPTVPLSGSSTAAETASLGPDSAANPTASPSESAAAVTPVLEKEASEIDYTDKKLVALTFDDGPNTDTTPLVLDKLEKYGVVASFFLEGQYVSEATKPVMERQIELGCEINNHSWSHSYLNTFTPDQIKKEIQDTNDIINKMAGVTPKFFRPPFIVTSEDMYKSIDLPFICGVGCSDWVSSITAEDRADTILGNIKDGDIILMHDFTGNINTVDALDTIIPGLLDEGYAFVTVSRLFELKDVDPDVENKIWTNTGN